MTQRQRWRPSFLSILFAIVFSAFLFIGASPVLAQEPLATPPSSDQTSSAVKTGASDQQTDEKQKDDKQKVDEKTGTGNDRIFGVLPNYLTVENAKDVPPLRPSGKFKLAAESSFDPAVYPFIGFVALIAQAQNSDPEWHQGVSGYAKRYGSAFGDATIGTFMTTAIAPSILHQDPRYYQLGHGTFLHRTVYSVSRIFVTRSDSGHNQFNLSEISGNAVAAGLSNIYSPRQERGVPDTLTTWGTDIMWDTLDNVIKEFWPDIRKKLFKKKDK